MLVIIKMSISPQKQPSSSSGIVAPTFSNMFISFAKSRLPVPNKPKTRHHHRRTFLSVAPVPFAPLVDTHTFQPPPPYTAHADASADVLPVPHNTPTASPPPSHGQSLSASTSSHTQLIGLGLEGVEREDGCRFDGLGRLSGGFRGTGDTLREEVHRMLSASAQRRRTRASEQPATQHDVFYASVEVKARRTVSVPVKIRIRRKSMASPTPVSKRWEGVMRGTISSELKRAASLERRASLSESTRRWRM